MKIKIPYTIPATQRTGRNEVELELNPKVVLKALLADAPNILWDAGLSFQPSKSPWIKVSDQPPPKDEEWFLAKYVNEAGEIEWLGRVRWNDGWSGHWQEPDSDARYFTHWMPIPE